MSENLKYIQNALQEFEYVEIDNLPEGMQETAINIHMTMMVLSDGLEEMEDEEG